MKKFLFIGIDFSKSKFDVSLLESLAEKNVAHTTFENTVRGYKDFLGWVSKQSKLKRCDWRFCGEHTGLYSRGLAEFLVKKHLFIWLENPLQIKFSSGIKRMKTDRYDSLTIARYACRYIDKAVVYKIAGKEINSLQLLISYRGRLVKNKVALETAASETRGVIQHDASSRFVYEHSLQNIARMKKEIKSIEENMTKIIMHSSLKENYLLMLSIKGIGMQTAIQMLIHTNNFTGFRTARQLACYCGCAPFPNESGSIDKGTHISHLADKDLKVLLSQCAVSAMQYNKELSAYASRKISEGKSKRLVINNVRNKLIQRIFAVVTTKTPYCENYLNPFVEVA